MLESRRSDEISQISYTLVQRRLNGMEMEMGMAAMAIALEMEMATMMIELMEMVALGMDGD